ncbi:hypothetical protein D3C71_1651820 [compost metagenome]
MRASPCRPLNRSARSIMTWVVLPVIKVEGGNWARCMRCMAFCTAIAHTISMPAVNAGSASLSAKGPKASISAAASASSSTWAAIRRRMGAFCCAANALLARRVSTTAAQKTGSASSLETAPALPWISAAPSVTKLPVTCAANRPLSARNPAVST